MAFSRKTAFELIVRAHGQGRMGHAYLISGPMGSGKRALVSDIATLLCGASTAKDILSHPDLHSIEPESKSRRILTDQVRDLERALQMRSSTKGRKIGVIFEADRLQIQASNAFLKTLEEPPDNSLLLLTTALPEALPDTILSRCITIQLQSSEAPTLTETQKQLLSGVSSFYKGKARDLAAIYSLVRLFTGLLQQSKEQIKGAHQEEFKREQALYKQTTDGKYLENREEHFDALTESRYVQTRFQLVDTLIQWWADVVRQQQGYGVLDFPDFSADTAGIGSQMQPSEALKRIDWLEELRENFGRNVQEQLAVEVAFLRVFA